MIPSSLRRQIKLLEARAKAMRFSQRKVALFDLDNTLLVGDIGEAVSAQLIGAGAVRSLSWSGYQSHLHQDAARAYRHIVSAMEGLSVREIEEATQRIGQPQKFCFVPPPGNHSFRNNVRILGEHRRIVVESAMVSAEA